MVLVADAHAAEIAPDMSVKDILRSPTAFCCRAWRSRKQCWRSIAPRRKRWRGRFLHERRVIGLLTEAYALRRYAAELERRRKELVGDE